MLKELLRNSMKSVGSPDQCHAVAIDARAPKFDGGIVSRLDSVPFGIAVNKHAQRFYDEGEDFWPQALRNLGQACGRAAGSDRLLHHRFEEHRQVYAVGISGDRGGYC